MALKFSNYADVVAGLNALVSANGLNPAQAPHHVFWNSLTYDQFINGNVPNVGVPFGGPYKILVVGDHKNSNIWNALNGTPGTPFGPDGDINQMPQPSPPYNASTPTQTDVTNALADWIDAQCPNPTQDGTTTDVPATC